MIKVLIVNNKVVAQRSDDEHGSQNWLDVTNHPDGPNFLQRTYDGRNFGPEPSKASTRRQVLKDIRTQRAWTADENQEAIAELL